MHDRTLAQASSSAELIARLGFQSQITAGELQRGRLLTRNRDALDKALTSKRLDDGLARIKIWNRNGIVVYSDKKAQVGNRYQLFSPLRQALGGHTVAVVTDLNRSEVVSGDENVGKVLEVYVPLELADNAPAGAINFFLPYGPIAKEISHETRTLYLLLLGGIGLVWAILFRIVAGASKRLRRQADELERHAAEKEYQALHDPLTELPNRALFGERIQYALYDAHDDRQATSRSCSWTSTASRRSTTRSATTTATCCCRSSGRRLEQALRDGDTVARLGGDEFGVLLPTLAPTGAWSTVVAERIRSALERAVRSSTACRSTSRRSIGIAHLPRPRRRRRARSCSAPTSPCTRPRARTRGYEIYDERAGPVRPRAG